MKKLVYSSQNAVTTKKPKKLRQKGMCICWCVKLQIKASLLKRDLKVGGVNGRFKTTKHQKRQKSVTDKDVKWSARKKNLKIVVALNIIWRVPRGLFHNSKPKKEDQHKTGLLPSTWLQSLQRHMLYISTAEKKYCHPNFNNENGRGRQGERKTKEKKN